MVDPTHALQRRAALTRQIRRFFDERDVLEVATPLLSQAAVTDVNIDSFAVATEPARYLRTSPEFAHKRLLSRGAPDLYELGPVFRHGERGRLHSPEFQLLEWYRRGFTLQRLIDEVVSLVCCVNGGALAHKPLRQTTYFELFEATLGVDVKGLDAPALSRLAAAFAPPQGEMDVDQWLDFLFSTQVQSALKGEGIVVVTHYPASQAALAQLDPQDTSTALRFEVFVDGVELANGFEELSDPDEQRARFEVDNATRVRMGRSPMPIDHRLVDALNHLPPCSGVALGFERLLMLAYELDTIDQTLTFDWSDI